MVDYTLYRSAFPVSSQPMSVRDFRKDCVLQCVFKLKFLVAPKKTGNAAEKTGHNNFASTPPPARKANVHTHTKTSRPRNPFAVTQAAARGHSRHVLHPRTGARRCPNRRRNCAVVASRLAAVGDPRPPVAPLGRREAAGKRPRRARADPGCAGSPAATPSCKGASHGACASRPVAAAWLRGRSAVS